MSETTETTSSRQSNLSAATNAANKRLKEAHIDEWNTLMSEEAKARGEEWEPKKTPEQKAAEELAALIEKFPHLAENLTTTSTKDDAEVVDLT